MKGKLFAAVILLVLLTLFCGLSLAEETAATPTDLAPEKQEKVQEKPAEKETA